MLAKTVTFCGIAYLYIDKFLFAEVPYRNLEERRFIRRLWKGKNLRFKSAPLEYEAPIHFRLRTSFQSNDEEIAVLRIDREAVAEALGTLWEAQSIKNVCWYKIPAYYNHGWMSKTCRQTWGETISLKQLREHLVLRDRLPKLKGPAPF